MDRIVKISLCVNYVKVLMKGHFPLSPAGNPLPQVKKLIQEVLKKECNFKTSVGELRTLTDIKGSTQVREIHGTIIFETGVVSPFDEVFSFRIAT